MLGVSDDQIDGLVAAGHLQRVFRGVYAVGNPRLTREGRYMAAVLAAGDGAVLSHFAAADLHALRAAAPTEIDVTAPKKRRAQTGLRPHVASVPARERTTRGGVPVTTPARTILDLATHLNARQLEDLMRRAEYARCGTCGLLAESLIRRPNRRGNGVLRVALEGAQGGRGITRSALERQFRALLRRHGIRPPQHNAAVHLAHVSYEVDCLWPDAKLVVELDGRGAHLTAAAFEVDRMRDADLAVAGYRVIRITWRRLRESAAEIVEQLAALLAA